MTEFQYLDGGNSEAQDRLATSYLFAQVSQGKATTGVLSGLAVTQTATASVSVLVGAGAGVSQDTVGNGVALMVNDTQKTLDVLTANPMGGTPRNDIVVFDAATKTIRAIIGTPNAVPTDPTVPTTAIPLARLRHAASATTIPTAKIDDLRVFTGLLPISEPVLAFTPAWTADTSAPNKGTDGTLTGTYRKYANGEVEATILLTLGTTGTSGGVGAYKLSLPVPADTTREVMGRAIYTVAGGGTYVMSPSFSTSSAVRLLTGAEPAKVWATTVPETITASTTVKLRLRYTAA